MSKLRLTTLDGLKGIAILSVMLTHMPLSNLYELVPAYYHRLLAMLTGGGGVGVTFFFIITGFLMYLRHPTPLSIYGFISKRYVRLFPPFLVFVIFFGIMQFLKNPSPKFQIELIVCLAIVMRLAIGVIGYFNSKFPIGKILFFGFIVLQFVVAFYYVYYLLNIPSAVFYQIWQPVTQKIITFIVNVTLTLPFGQYIAQLDGVYWALVLELLFYILYPVVIAPVFFMINKTSGRKKHLLYISLLPFCFGLFLIGERILGFTLLRLHYFIYFFAGIIIASYYEKLKVKFGKFINLIAHPFWILACIFLSYSSIIINVYVSKIYDPWLTIIMVIPVSLLLFTAVVSADKKNILTNPLLIMLGKLSYILFLTHSMVIHIVEKTIPSNSLANTFLIIGYSIIGSLILSIIIYYLTEAPFHHFSKKKIEKITLSIYSQAVLSQRIFIFPIVIFIITFIAFKPNISLTSYAIRSGGADFFSLMNDNTVTLTDKPYRQPVNSGGNNLGMILTYMRNDKIPGVVGGFAPFKLNMSLLTTDNKVLARNVFNAYEIMDSRFHPFGFPLQSDSKGKKYFVEYQLSENSPSQLLKIVKNESDILSVYFPDKKQLVRNPGEFLQWFINKLNEPLSNKMFWFTLIHVLPLPLLTIVFCLKIKNNHLLA